MLSISLFFLQLILLFFISRLTIKELFYFFRKLSKNDNFIFSLISLMLLPGTALHEIAHFFMATILMLKVREVKIFPEWKDNAIKLGMVLYEKKDFIRGILVGIAPVFTGLFFFFFLAYLKLFPNPNILYNILFAYLIFIISLTMFSSKQDLVDLIFIIPMGIIIVGAIYVFNIDATRFLNQPVIENLSSVLSLINLYLTYSLIINMLLIAIFNLVKYIIRK